MSYRNHSRHNTQGGPRANSSPEPLLQDLTHPALQIRNVSDALIVVEAVRRGMLPLIIHRLSVEDREQVGAGRVYVWEESDRKGGLMRWTDGRKWSQSRVLGERLFYDEKVEITEEEREAKAQRRVQRIVNPGIPVPPPNRNQRQFKSDGLTKENYSFFVKGPGDLSRKWHLVAYSIGSERATYPTITHYPHLLAIRVPPGVFSLSRNRRVREKHVPSACGGSLRSVESTSIESSSSRGSRAENAARGLPQVGDSAAQRVILPQISTLSFNDPDGPRYTYPPPTRISPAQGLKSTFSDEDRRMLDSFPLHL
ncbi:unnamed protein product [Mycena citricolor]|uniref:cAMP-independent regulatory protein pac2 n=1 Tax=Mycena citricolor TaxID=2018698 RepID=A0AAD2Q4G3_9AGAR|nr:unnamed protein product [Mycena citricolor]CAK5275213.1 unnamed protein product [Mycena citricolor]